MISIIIRRTHIALLALCFQIFTGGMSGCASLNQLMPFLSQNRQSRENLQTTSNPSGSLATAPETEVFELPKTRESPPNQTDHPSSSHENSEDREKLRSLMIVGTESQKDAPSHLTRISSSSSSVTSNVFVLPRDAQILQSSLRLPFQKVPAGQCVSLTQSDHLSNKKNGTEQLERHIKSPNLVEFAVNPDSAPLIFIFHKKTKHLSFVGHPNAHGMFTCSLDHTQFVWGTSDGQSFISPEANTLHTTANGQIQITATFRPQVQVLLVAKASPADGSRRGTTPEFSLVGKHLRVGILHSAPLSTESGDQSKFAGKLNESSDYQIPFHYQVKNLNLTPSPGIKVHSYFSPSILIRSKTLSLSLPEGQYLIAVTDFLTNSTCYISAEINSHSNLVTPNLRNSVQTIEVPADSCNSSQEGDRTRTSEQPIPFSPQSPYSNATARNSEESFFFLAFPAQQEKSNFSAKIQNLFSSAEDRNLWSSFESEFTQPRFANFTRSQDSGVLSYFNSSRTFLREESLTNSQEQVVLDSSFSDFEDLSSARASKIEDYLKGHQVPDLAFLSVSEFAFDPFLVQNRVQLKSIGAPSSDSMTSTVTNGVLFRWNSPNVTSSLVSLPSDGLVALSVYIPAYNLTQYVEIYMNGSLYKRYVIDRRDFRKAQIFQIEELLEPSTDVQFAVYAWGDGYLPEFIYGQPRMRPRAILSRVCFDVNKNLICDNLR